MERMVESRDIKHMVCVERIKQLEQENKKLKEKNEKLEEDNINLISFNEHYSPDVIVKYEDRYETAYNEECIENAKLCDKMRRLEEENKKLKEKLSEITMVADDEKQSIEHILELEEENKKLKEENKELKDAMKELNNYNKFRIQENERLKKENEELQEYKSMYEGLC